MQPKTHRLQHAIQIQAWNKLKQEEIKVLKKVIEYNNYKTLFEEFIKSDFTRYWPIIEKLERLSLIEIQRGQPNNNISSIYFLPDLEKSLNFNSNSGIDTSASLTADLPKRKWIKNENRQKSSRFADPKPIGDIIKKLRK